MPLLLLLVLAALEHIMTILLCARSATPSMPEQFKTHARSAQFSTAQLGSATAPRTKVDKSKEQLVSLTVSLSFTLYLSHFLYVCVC